MLREAKRQNRAYQKVSLKVLGRYAAIRTDLDLSEDVLAISSSTVAGLVSTADEMDVDGPEAKIKDSLRDDIIISSASAASHVFSPAVVCSKGTCSPICRTALLTMLGFPKTFTRFVEIMSSANSIQDKLVAEAVFEALADAFHQHVEVDACCNHPGRGQVGSTASIIALPAPVPRWWGDSQDEASACNFSSCEVERQSGKVRS